VSPKPPVHRSQIQRSADAIARAIGAELPSLNPVERRELLVQMQRWLSGRVAAFDESAKKIKSQVIAPTAQETSITAGAFGKGSRSSDVIE
jgi:hypothetical protein